MLLVLANNLCITLQPVQNTQKTFRCLYIEDKSHMLLEQSTLNSGSKYEVNIVLLDELKISPWRRESWVTAGDDETVVKLRQT